MEKSFDSSEVLYDSKDMTKSSKRLTKVQEYAYGMD